VRSNLSFINVHKKANIKSEVVTQLLYGDTFKILKKKGSWLKIINNLDHYKGFVKKRYFLSNQKYTHKVFKLNANLYLKPNLKSKTREKLSFSSKIKIIKKKGNFYKFDNFWINKKNLKKINYKSKNIFENIHEFIDIKYLWGGKHFSGVDCSGLIHLLFNFNNRY